MINKLKFFTLLILSLFSMNAAYGFSADSTITISSAKDEYTFYREKQSNQVLVKQQLRTQYQNKLSGILPLGEFYDDNTTINTFTCRINNKAVKDFKPSNGSYSDSDIFHSDTKLSYFPLTTAPNSTIDVWVEKTITNPIYFSSIYFTDDYSIAEKQIQIKIPRWMNVNLKELNFEGYEILKTVSYLEKEDADLISYKVSHLPAMKHEYYSPGNSYTYPHLLILSGTPSGTPGIYFSSVQDQYNWYLQLTEKLDDDKDPVIKEQATFITKDAKTDLEKIKEIYYWMQENIRYIAFEDGIAGFKPDKASEVLRKKYGDCKGMANLTKALLNSLGFDARLCWLGTNHIAYNYSTPSLAVDNHMICALKFNQKTYFLDATETYLGFNEYAERIQGRQVLIEDGKNHLLESIPISDINANLDFQKKTLSIQDKDLVGFVEQRWKGEEKEILLSKINGMKKNVLKTEFINYLSNNNQNYSISDLKYSDLNQYDGEVKASFQLNFKNAADIFDKAYYLSLDADKEYNRFTVDAAKRYSDLWLPYKNNIQKEVILQIPTNYVVSEKPENLTIKTDQYEFSISYEVNGDKIIYKKNIRIFNPRIKKANFSAWNRDILKLSQQYNETITLKPKS